jgi:hypothetical protein
MRQYTRTYIRTRIGNVEEVWLNENSCVQHYKKAIPDAQFEPLFGSLSKPRLYRISVLPLNLAMITTPISSMRKLLNLPLVRFNKDGRSYGSSVVSMLN